ncbi:MAG: peroxiredoxin [Flavobacterium sp. BFFFF2]|nr:MAG: peroxiredoxin [Flavobacterium sp. BFFFF2]
MASLQVGKTLPYFELYDQNGQLFKSDAYVGNYRLVIYFYPKDHTPGCTKQACEFRVQYPAWSKEGVLVVGISSDAVGNHFQFAADYRLPFTLLSDPQSKLRKQWEVPRQMMGLLPGRVTYLVGLSGQIEHIIDTPFPLKHIDETRHWIESFHKKNLPKEV